MVYRIRNMLYYRNIVHFTHFIHFLLILIEGFREGNSLYQNFLWHSISLPDIHIMALLRLLVK